MLRAQKMFGRERTVHTPAVWFGHDMEALPLRLAWDTETTGIDKYAEIVSIGWCSVDGLVKGEVFSVPTCPIHPAALAIHGLCPGTLMENGAGNIKEALTRFFKAIEMIGEPVLLVAHNGKTFDTKRLRLAMAHADIQSVPYNVVKLPFLASFLKFAFLDFWNMAPSYMEGVLGLVRDRPICRRQAW